MPLSPAHIAALDTALDLFTPMTPEQHRENRGTLYLRSGQPRFAVLNALTEGRRWQLTLTEPPDLNDPDSPYGFTLTVYDTTTPTREADTYEGTPWAVRMGAGGHMLSVYEHQMFQITPEHRFWSFCHNLLQDVLARPWEFDAARWVKEQQLQGILPPRVARHLIASYDGQPLRRLPGLSGVFVTEPNGTTVARLTDNLQDSLSSSYVPAGFTLRQRIGDLEDAIREGNHFAVSEIIDLLRAKLGIKD